MKTKMMNHEMVLGTMISEIGWPNIPRMMKAGGFDFVIIDAEHGPFDYSQVAMLTAVGRGAGISVFVRIPAIDRGCITKYLDMGADGFLIPMVNTKEDAIKLVEFSKYAPMGKRGISTTRAHTDYKPPRLQEYMVQANQHTILLAQIETCQALDEVEKIASVPGIDALIVGPSDLSSDLGFPGEINCPEMRKAVDCVCAAAKRAGRVCGTVATNMEYLAHCQRQGMTLFSVGSELGMIVNGAKSTVTSFQEKVTGDEKQ